MHGQHRIDFLVRPRSGGTKGIRNRPIFSYIQLWIFDRNLSLALPFACRRPHVSSARLRPPPSSDERFRIRDALNRLIRPAGKVTHAKLRVAARLAGAWTRGCIIRTHEFRYAEAQRLHWSQNYTDNRKFFPIVDGLGKLVTRVVRPSCNVKRARGVKGFGGTNCKRAEDRLQ
jgi:hypothetical protein